jgi:hypothetical protein
MSTILQVLGMAAITVGTTMLSLTAGLIVGGVFLILAGIAVGRK